LVSIQTVFDVLVASEASKYRYIQNFIEKFEMEMKQIDHLFGSSTVNSMSNGNNLSLAKESLRLLREMELWIYRTISLEEKLPTGEDLIEKLLEKGELSVSDQKSRDGISALFLDKRNGLIPEADSKEFVIRNVTRSMISDASNLNFFDCNRIATRMYVFMNCEDYRLATAQIFFDATD